MDSGSTVILDAEILEEFGIVVFTDEAREIAECLTALEEYSLKAEEPLPDEPPSYDLRPRRVKIKKQPAISAAAFNRKTVRSTSPARRNRPGGRRK